MLAEPYRRAFRLLAQSAYSRHANTLSVDEQNVESRDDSRPDVSDSRLPEQPRKSAGFPSPHLHPSTAVAPCGGITMPSIGFMDRRLRLRARASSLIALMSMLSLLPAPARADRGAPLGDTRDYVNPRGHGEFGAKNRAEGWNMDLAFAISPSVTAK